MDRKSLHVLQADEGYGLGGSMPRESYLNQARVIEISRAGLLVLTAMKTENEICSRTNGRVMTIHVEKGKTVETGEPLVTIAGH